jgi:amidohydrolase
MNIKEVAAKYADYQIEMRRYFHMHPEVSCEEFETSKAIKAELDKMGIPYRDCGLKTGILATIEGAKPGKTILLRADIDALTVHETTGAEYASVNEGVMHACGHDCHIAMQLGSLRVLSQMRDALHGEVRAVFQPSEENGGGSALMINAGACEGVDGAYAAHIWSEVAAGTISCEPGPRMANTDWFRVDIRGTSCHGAMPQRGADAIIAAAEIVNNLQTIVSRDLSPYEPAVVTVGELHGGTARNVIAGTAYLTGTVRTYSASAHEAMPKLIERIAIHTAQALGAEAELTEYTVAHGAVVNDEMASERCRRAIVEVLGTEAVGRYQGTLSGEDFSRYLELVPGVLAFVGTRNPAIGATFAQHSCFYKVDESVLAKGAMLAAQYAVDFLAE